MIFKFIWISNIRQYIRIPVFPGLRIAPVLVLFIGGCLFSVKSALDFSINVRVRRWLIIERVFGKAYSSREMSHYTLKEFIAQNTWIKLWGFFQRINKNMMIDYVTTFSYWHISLTKRNSIWLNRIYTLSTNNIKKRFSV